MAEEANPAPQVVQHPMLRAALRYARQGYRVVILHGLHPTTKSCTCKAGTECPGPGKHPRLKDWTHKATTDLAALQRQYQRWPNSNVGIMPKPGTVVVDIDPRNGGERPPGIPDKTPTQQTGGGGAHYIVRVPDGATLPKLPGVDYRHPDKGQIVVEPSLHTSGGRYVWQPGLGPGLLPGAWDVPHVAADNEDGTGGTDLPPLVTVEQALDAPVQIVQDWLAVVPSDTYGDWINVGQALKHAYGDDAFELWDSWSSKSDKYPGHAALQEKWRSFDRNRDRALRTLRTVRHLAQQNGWRYAPPELDFSSDLWRRGLISDLVSQPAPALDWVINQVLPRGKVVMLSGPGGAGKSFLMLVLAIQHCLGVPLLGDAFVPAAQADARKVISFTAEDDRDDVHRRLESVFSAYMLTDDQKSELGHQFSLQCTRGKDWRLVEDVGGTLVASKACDLIIDKLRSELGLSLIMFDPSVMFAGVDENDNAAVATYMRVLDRIASTLNCAVLVGTHTNKGALAADVIDQSAVRGAGAFVDNARGAWVLRTMTVDEAAEHAVPDKDRHQYACLRVAKNNYGPAGAELWLQRVAGGALRVATMPSVSAAVRSDGATMPPLVPGATKAERRKGGIRAAALHAHATSLLQHIKRNADPLVGAAELSERQIGTDLWGADPALSVHGIRDRTRRVIEYCEAQGWLEVVRPDEAARKYHHQPSTYAVTPEGEELLK